MKLKRILSMILVLTMVITSATISIVNAESSYEINEFMFDSINGIKSTLNKALFSNGNGTYTYRLQTGAFLRNVYEGETREFSESDVVNIQSAGYYLFELWGGDGGTGQNISGNSGGTGGNGGYVYGIINLKKGQSVIMNVGSNGVATKKESYGQGVNGDGGAHGDRGNYEVGGGGGYTALYLFDEARATPAITETERINNYIMIAGGGGGGGAGNQLGYTPKGTPDGGIGGDIINSASGHLSIKDNRVAGTYFIGQDGQTSGDDNSTAGKGGSNVPGEIVQTSGGSYSSASMPNNWEQTAVVPDSLEAGELVSSGGAGGAGNFRGGAGGAGFCGGSGGVMHAALIGKNVGGGGGGSSFIADSVQWEGLPPTVTNLLLGSDYAKETGLGILTYIGPSYENLFETKYYKDVSITGTISKYFEIQKVECSDDDATVVYNSATGDVAISNVDISPDDKGFMKNECEIEITFRPKEDFAGGNMVPVLNNNEQFSIKLGDTAITNKFKPHVETDYLNIPLQFSLSSRSYTEPEGTTINVKDLFVSDLDEINLGDWQYDFIDYVSDVRVTNRETDEDLDINGTITPTGTTRYNISCTVEPKYEPAKVGTPIEEQQTYSAVATVAILSEDEDVLDGVTVKTNKKLAYNNENENYEFSVVAKQQTEWKTDKRDTDFTEITFSVDKNAGTWIVPADGWYYVQIWGGVGGGAGSSTYNYPANTLSASGASGGAAGYIGGYVHLLENNVVRTYVGSVGTTSSDYSYDINITRDQGGMEYNNAPGTKGGKSWIEVGDIPILGAAGGSGAGGSSIMGRNLYGWSTYANNSAAGVAPSGLVTQNDGFSKFIDAGDGVAGQFDLYKSGTKWVENRVNGSAGSAGNYFRNTDMALENMPSDLQGKSVSLPAETKIPDSNGGTSNGGIRIKLLHCDWTDIEDTSPDTVKDISVSGKVSKYFQIDDIGLNIPGATVLQSNTGLQKTNEYEKTGAIVGSVSYILTENGDGTTSYTANASRPTYETITELGNSALTNTIEVILYVTPKTGFLGGNDVPFVIADTSDSGTDGKGNKNQGVKVQKGTDFFYPKQEDKTDYANVEIANAIDDSDIKTNSVRIAMGDTVDLSSLYSVQADVDAGWQSDFVEVEMPSLSTVSPIETTDYPVEVRITPKADAAKAIVVESVDAHVATDTITVFVNDYGLDERYNNLTSQGSQYVAISGETQILLTPNDGYRLPDTITVENADYVYDKNTGRITLTNPTNTVVIYANAVERTYTLCYEYQDWEGDGVVTKQSYVYNLRAGDVITNDFANSITSNVLAHRSVGYDYYWDWMGFETNSSGGHIMPAKDADVFGAFAPKVSSLTVNYYKAGTSTKIAESYYIEYMAYDTAYDVVSPLVSGYIADIATVTGTKGEDDEVINVYYSPTKQAVYINYIYGDTGRTVTSISAVEDELPTDQYYRYNSPAITGYTPDKAYVSGTMGTVGVVYNVYYYPNEYCITFDPNGGNISSANQTRYVYYNKEIGYDAEKDAYSSLPVPTKANSKFLGWKYGDDYVSFSTVYTYTENITLVAQWELNKYNVTIYYEFDDDSTKNYKDVYQNIPYGQSYSYDVPDKSGYNKDKTVVSGTMGAGHQSATVHYTKIDDTKYTIVVNYVYPTGLTAYTSVSQTFGAYDDKSYSFKSPTIPGYVADQDVVSGTLTETYKVVTVTYDPEYVDSALVEFKDGSYVVASYPFTAGGSLTGKLIPKVPGGSEGYFKGWDTTKELLSLDYYEKNKTFDVVDTTDEYTPFKATYYATKYDSTGFGSAKISDAKAQAAVLWDGTTAIRFYAMVDENYKDYVEAGFVITDKYITPTLEAGYQYSKQGTIYKIMYIAKSKDDEGKAIEAEESKDFSITGVGILCTNLTVDTKTNAKKPYYATPYLKLKNGSYVYGNTKRAVWNELL